MEQRRFAAARRTKQANEFAGFDVEIDAFQRDDFAAASAEYFTDLGYLDL